MLPICDYIVVTLSLTPQTANIIDEDQFKVMKRSAAFINVSRGLFNFKTTFSKISLHAVTFSTKIF